MSTNDEKMRVLAEKVQEKGSYILKLKTASTQKTTLEQKAADLEKQFAKENADVTALEGHGVAALFYAAIGKKEEKLDKERAEAFAAKAKYDAALRELAAAESDVAFFEQKLREVDGYEEEYRACFAQKVEELKKGDTMLAMELLQLEQTIAEQTHQLKELREAIAAGRAALAIVAEIETHLNSAEDWGTWDLFGGGMLTDMAKHDHLNTAQALVEKLQGQLRRFQTELADVQVNSEIQISIEGFLGFADFFFDGLFADWMVMDKIKNAAVQVSQTKTQIQSVQYKLDILQDETSFNLQCNQEAYDALVVKA